MMRFFNQPAFIKILRRRKRVVNVYEKFNLNWVGIRMDEFQEPILLKTSIYDEGFRFYVF